MIILLTGSEGFIGSSIKRLLIEHNYNVLCFDKKLGNDLLNFSELETFIKNSDIVLHVAAQANLYEMEELNAGKQGTEINVNGTHNVAFLCSKHGKKLIYTSTVCVYGNRKTQSTPESLPNPSDLYAYSKLAGELIVKGYARNFNLDYIILRIATTYGATMRPALGMHIFITQAMQGNDITVHGNGKQTRTLTYVEDIANAFLLAVQNFNNACGNTFNICSEEKISAIKMAKDIKRLLKSKSRIKSISQRKNQTYKENICIKKTKKLLKWKPDTSWNDGLKKTVLNFK